LRFASCLVLMASSCIGASAQDGVVRGREYSYGVENSFEHLIPTKDGNYIAHGILTNNSLAGHAIVKYTPQLTVLWEKTSPKPLNGLSQMPDGGFVACTGGYSTDHPFGSELEVIRYDQNFNVTWRKTYGGNANEGASDIGVKPNGEIVVIANTRSTDGDVMGKTTADADIWVLVLDASGNILRQKVFGGPADEFNAEVVVTSDGGIALSLYSWQFPGNKGGADVWLIKTDALLTKQWEAAIGGSGSDIANGISQISMGEYIICGSTTSTDFDFAGGTGGNTGFITKVSAGGNVIWSKLIGGESQTQLYNACELPGGELAVVGQTIGHQMAGLAMGFGHVWTEGLLLKYSSTGHLLMQRAVGSACDEILRDVVRLPNGNFLVCGLNSYCSNGGDFTNVPKAVGESRSIVLEIRDLSTIKGKVFFDDNNNRIFDAGEGLLSSGKVQTTKGAIGFNVDLTIGPDFIVSTDTGSYFTQIVRTYDWSAFPYDTTVYSVSPKKKVSVFTAPGQRDSFNIRLVRTTEVEDLEVLVQSTPDAYLNNSIKCRINVRNVGGKTIPNAIIKIRFDDQITYKSANKPVVFVGDTLQWQLPSFAGKARDSMEIVFYAKTPDVKPGDTLRFEAYGYPIDTDFDPLDNTVILSQIVRKQAAAVSGLDVQFTTSTPARLTRTIPHTIVYNFNSSLDSTKGKVIVFKDSKTYYSSAIPAPSRISGDSVIWNIKDVRNNNQDTILLNLQVASDPVASIGDSIRQEVIIQLDVQDSTLFASKRLSQKIVGSYVQPDTTTTTLHPPHGTLWTRIVGGDRYDYANDVIALPDNGFITIGAVSQPGSSPLNAAITRFDKDGHILWQKDFGNDYNDVLYTVRKINDSTFLAAGTTYLYTAQGNNSIDEALIVKFNARGDILWRKNYGGDWDDIAQAVEPTADGGFIFNGYTRSRTGDVVGYVPYDHNMWVLKLDASGTIEWSKCYAGVGDYTGSDIRSEGIGGGYFISGNRNNNKYPKNPYDAFVMKIDAVGNKLWEKHFHNENYQYVINSMAATGSNEIVVAGYAGDDSGTDTAYNGDHGGVDVWVAKLDGNGNVLWQNFFGGKLTDMGHRVQATKDGGYLIAAQASSMNGNVTDHSVPYFADAWLLKINGEGKLLWQKIVAGKNMEILNGVAELPDGNIITVGTAKFDGVGTNDDISGPLDVFIAKVGQANYITGKVFVDYNNNHIQDQGEPLFNKGIVTFSRDSLSASGTVGDGMYGVLIDKGTFQAKLTIVDSALYTIYPVNPVLSINTYLNTDTLNFALLPKSNSKDLRVDLIPVNRARAGFEAVYQVKYENNGPFPMQQVELRFIADHRSIFTSSSIPYGQQKGDTLIWKFSNLDAFATGIIDVRLLLKAPPAIMPGDSLALRADIIPVANDLKPLDNIAAFKQFVGVAYDPNDKTEIHGADFNARHIQDGEYLKYLIRFQNTGNDTAFTVYVRDTLSDKVDWNTLEMISASHAYDLHIRDGNKLEWRFNNILLVDSNMNEPASHGFIAYRIKPKNTLQIGDTVKNTASIYFDFNPAVLTNTAQSVVSQLTILPFSKLSFEGKWLNENTTQLNWAVEDEVNVAYYAVQRSADGIVYEEIGRIAALKTSWKNKYGFTDNAPLAGRNYYRIAIVDLDHSSELSRIVLLKRTPGITGQLLIRPNPSQGKIMLSLNGPVKGIGSLTIVDVNGVVVRQTVLGYLDQPSWQKNIDLSGLPAGQYYLQCKVGDQVFGGKLIKL
jgi:uncharacterized repeat protein (TIGR01451 family)